MNTITLKFQNSLSEDSLESLFDTVATIIPEDSYIENTAVSDGIESNYNLTYHVTHGEHCYEIPLARPLSVQEGKALHSILDNAIEQDYTMEISANANELQNRYNFNNFEGSIQEGDLE